MKKHIITLCAISSLMIGQANAQNVNKEIASLKDRLNNLEKSLSKSNLDEIRFNPKIGLLLNGKYHKSSNKDDEFNPAGFQLGNHSHSAPQGFSLYESELSLSADIDDLFSLNSNIIFADEDGEDKVEIEELYAQTSKLPYGLSLKIGRFLPNIGYLNSNHLHSDNFANRSIAFRSFLGNHYFDDGAQLSWLLPTSFYNEIGFGLFSGRNFPASSRDKNGTPVKSAFFKTGGNLLNGEIQLGASYLSSKTGETDRQSIHSHDGEQEINAFSGESNLFIADLKYSFSLSDNIKENEIIIQGEYFKRNEKGLYYLEHNGVVEEEGNVNTAQSGYYAQAIYKFLPKWRVGYRYSKLFGSKNKDIANFDEGILQHNNHRPSANTIMVDYTNSEFSRIRFEYENQKLQYNDSNDSVTIQYIFSIGAHPAHKF